MGKNKKPAGKPSNGPAPPSQAPDDAEDDELGGIFADELDITIATIKFLSERPELFASKPFKELRAVLDPLVQVSPPSPHSSIKLNLVARKSAQTHIHTHLHKAIMVSAQV
jgi:hypothetical protein